MAVVYCKEDVSEEICGVEGMSLKVGDIVQWASKYYPNGEPDYYVGVVTDITTFERVMVHWIFYSNRKVIDELGNNLWHLKENLKKLC